MHQLVLSAQIPNQRSAPAISTWLPGNNVVTSVDLLEESSEIANVLAGWQEGFRTLEYDDLCPKNLSYLFGALPCEPHLLGRAKAAIEISFCGAQGRFQAGGTWGLQVCALSAAKPSCRIEIREALPLSIVLPQ